MKSLLLNDSMNKIVYFNHIIENLEDFVLKQAIGEIVEIQCDIPGYSSGTKLFVTNINYDHHAIYPILLEVCDEKNPDPVSMAHREYISATMVKFV